MARVQSGSNLVSGTIANVTFVKKGGRQYARKKSSLTGERVMKDKAFEKTRQYAGNFATAARIGSVIYKALPFDMRRERWFYRTLAGEAASLLYEGKDEQQVVELLWKKYVTDTGTVPANAQPLKQGEWNGNLTTKESNLKMREAFLDRWNKQGLGDYWYKRTWPKRGKFNMHRFRDGLNSAVRQREEAANYR